MTDLSECVSAERQKATCRWWRGSSEASKRRQSFSTSDSVCFSFWMKVSSRPRMSLKPSKERSASAESDETMSGCP